MTTTKKADPLAKLDLPKLIEQFGNEDKCRDYLEGLRWPNGVSCPRCESTKISRIVKRNQFECDSCRYQFSVRVGTVLQDSKLPLWKWFLAVYLIGEAKKGVSANQLKRTLGVSYETAWYLCHRIRAAMKDEGADLLSGVVEIDETYIGGKPRYKGDRYSDWRGRKTMVMGAVSRDGKVKLRAMPKPSLTRDMAREFVKDTVAPDAEAIYTDEFVGYPDLTKQGGTKHRRINHSHEWVNGQVHTNTVESVWSLFDRSVIGSYHKLSVKHLPAYLDEAAFRWNERGNPYLFRDTLLRLIGADPLTYRALTKPS